MRQKLIVRIKGGLGNQLFCYAAARRLSIVNDVELIIDNITGFSRDYRYHRQYKLDGFEIISRLANSQERCEPFERFQRALIKLNERRKPFIKRRYIEQEFADYDLRLLDIRLVESTVVIDGLWQSAYYFNDIEPILRGDLQFKPQNILRNQDAFKWIKHNNAIAIHIRWFGGVGSKDNVPFEYYRLALSVIRNKVRDPYFAVFSDDSKAALQMLGLPTNRILNVDWNGGDCGELADMWLMSNCTHYIIANSTFSWWGAWLGALDPIGQLILFPRRSGVASNRSGWSNSWDYTGQMPKSWTPIIVDE